ncbi:MAG: VWA domain-containing protein, partial [Thermoleophilia bacterium]
ASLTAGAGAKGTSDSLLPGTPVDVPGSLHPSEIIDGIEIAVRDRQQEADLLILDDEDEDEDGDVPGESFTYHEWDREIGDFRTGWCTVRYRDVLKGDPGFVEDTIARFSGEVLLIRRQFERLRPDRIRRFFRQQDGDELDLDALTEALVDVKAGAPMSDKVFIRRDKKQRDVAVLFLLDMSDSTDQVVAEGQRVIDVEKQGLVLLSEAIGQLDDRYAVMGFTSRGRRHVDLFRIKDFQDDFDEAVAGRIAGVEPFDYTRLGAALRHSSALLAREEAGVRLLVLLSDGRPYDMGYGDMRYAMEDTKMALAEATRTGIKVFCITVDPEGPKYLEDMFGANRYTVIQNVSHLPTKLPRIYRNLTV